MAVSQDWASIGPRPRAYQKQYTYYDIPCNGMPEYVLGLDRSMGLFWTSVPYEVFKTDAVALWHDKQADVVAVLSLAYAPTGTWTCWLQTGFATTIAMNGQLEDLKEQVVTTLLQSRLT